MNKKMKYSFFIGCSVPIRSINYEMSSLKVAEKLGIELVYLHKAICCGFPIASVDEKAGKMMAAWNIALSLSMGLNKIICLCSACTGFLSRIAKQLNEDKDFAQEVGAFLKKEKPPLQITEEVEVVHFARLIYEEVNAESISRTITRPLKNLRVAAHYGCHYLRPWSREADGENPENPSSLDSLISVTGALSVTYENKLGCCGGSILGIKEQTALKIAGKKLDSVRAASAECIVTICPFCTIMYEGNQKRIEKNSGTKYEIPVLYYPQLLGLALGIDEKQLGLNFNRIKPEKILKKIGLRD